MLKLIISVVSVSLALSGCGGQNQAGESAPQSSESVPTERRPNNESSPPPAERTQNVRAYGAGDIVSGGLLDKAGRLWFAASNEGVYCYDGASFTNFTVSDGLNSNHVYSILEDRRGSLWFGTDDGLCKYDGKTFTHVSIPGSDDDSKVILCLLEDQQRNIWMGTWGSGAYRYDGETFTSFLKNEGKTQADGRYRNAIQSITEDSNGNIWFTSMTHGGVSRYDGKTLAHFTLKDGLSDDMVFSSCQDRAGNLWFGTRDKGMCRFDGKSFTNFTEADGLRNNCVSCIYQDTAGKFWIGTGRSGMCCFDGKTFTPFPQDESQNLEDIRFAVEDKSGNLWFGGRYGILWRFDGQALTDFTRKGR